MLKIYTPFSLRNKTIILGVTLFLMFAGLNVTTFFLLRGYMKSLSSMMDVVVVANDLKTLSGTATEGLPFEIEEYSLHPSKENKEKILKKFDRISFQLNKLKKELKSDEAKIKGHLVSNMFANYLSLFSEMSAELEAKKVHIEEINERIKSIKETSALIAEYIESLISIELKYDEKAKEVLAQKADANGIKLLLIIFITAIGSAFLFYFFLVRKNILIPLGRMKDTMELITKNMSNINLRVKVDHFDEIGVLGKYFNEMADQIEENQLNLESTIEKRTNELESARAQNIQSSKLASLGEMAGGVAHEINTPLAAIMLNAEIILMEAESLDPPNKAIEKYAISIGEIGDRISKIISGLKNFSRDASADENQIFSVGKLISDTMNLCNEKFKNHNIKVIIKEECLETLLNGQIIHISQTLLNLLNNSFDAIEKLKEKWISIEVAVIGKELRLSVTDSGSGIPKDIVNKMFQPFFTTKEIGKGTGLGLGISIGIIQRYGGNLIYDEEYKNTRFIICLPIADSNMPIS